MLATLEQDAPENPSLCAFLLSEGGNGVKSSTGNRVELTQQFTFGQAHSDKGIAYNEKSLLREDYTDGDKTRTGRIFIPACD